MAARHRKKNLKKKVQDEHRDKIIIENGSALIKAGFCGSSSPRAVFPSIVGRPRHQGVMVGMAQKELYIGDEAQSKRGILKELSHPIHNGIIQNWDEMEAIWRHALQNEIRIDVTEHPVLLSESVLDTKENRRKKLQIMFDKLQVPAVYFANTAVLSLFCSGRTTGIVLESGYQQTRCVPIVDGFVLREAITCSDLGGADVTNYLDQLLSERGYSFVTSAEKEILRDVKEKLGYVAMDYADELQQAEEASNIDCGYELPDGQVMDSNALRIARFQSAECLFRPELIGKKETKGISALLAEALLKTKANLSAMAGNIVFAGGNTMFDGMADRVKKDLEALMKTDERLVYAYVRIEGDGRIPDGIVREIVRYCPEIRIKCIAPPERRYSVWIGGSILVSQLPDDSWIGKDEYDECGPDILDKKGFV